MSDEETLETTEEHNKNEETSKENDFSKKGRKITQFYPETNLTTPDRDLTVIVEELDIEVDYYAVSHESKGSKTDSTRIISASVGATITQFVEGRESMASKDTDQSSRSGVFFRHKSEMDAAEEMANQLKEQFLEEFFDLETFANVFVDYVIQTAIEKIRTDHNKSDEYTFKAYSYSEFEFEWPTIQDFTIELGEIKIDRFVSAWELENDWMYCIDYICEQTDTCSDYYLYEVKWSIPTFLYPVPQATASVYFTVEVSRVIPNESFVKVNYVFEGSRFVHTPGKIAFREQWLFDIVDNKIDFFKTVRF